MDIAEKENFNYADVDQLGSYKEDNSFDQRHIDAVKALELADLDAIKKRKFRVCVDTINSVGGVILPKLLQQIGVEYTLLNGNPTGDFAHNPEPIEKNLGGIMAEIKKGGYDLGIVVDPDVDRLAFRIYYTAIAFATNNSTHFFHFCSNIHFANSGRLHSRPCKRKHR